MKIKYLLLLLFPLLLTQCTIVNDTFVSVNPKVGDDFTAIDAGAGWSVVVTQGERNEVTLEVPSDYTDRVSAHTRDGVLYLDKQLNGRIEWGSKRPTAHVTIRNLTGLYGREAAIYRFGSRIVTDGEFGIEMDEAASVEGLQLSAESCIISAEEGSRIEMSGKTNLLEIEAEDAVKIYAKGFVSRSCIVDVSEASEAYVHATEYLKARADDSSLVECYGSPAKVDKRAEESSKIRVY